MNEDRVSVHSLLQSLKVIYFALLSGMMMFALIILFINERSEEISLGTEDPLILLSLLLSIFLLAFSFWIFRRAMRTNNELEQLDAKLSHYQNYFIVRLAIVEIPALFSLVCYFLNSNTICLFTFGLTIVYFVSLYPSVQRFSNDTGVHI